MIAGRDIIVFSDDWGRHPFSCQHLMNVFRTHNRLLWVNTIGLRNPTLSLYDIKRIFEKGREWMKRSETESMSLPSNLEIIAPFMVPYNQFSPMRTFNKRQVISRVRKAADGLKFKDPIVISSLPNSADYIGHLDEVLDVYYCVDEFSEWPGVQKQLASTLENELLGKVDFVAAVSDRLAKNKKAANGPTHLLTHGVDLNHFQKAGRVKPDKAFETIKKPVIGYFGLIDERTDQDLLEKILTFRPDYSVVLIGNTKVSLDRLEPYGNFHHLPPVSYESLPHYVAGFDVAILPYVLNELSRNINPLKLKEYIASGVPVVSTPLPEVLKLGGAIRAADTKDKFPAAIDEALNGGQQADVEAVLKGQTWADKAEMFSEWIIQAMERKGLFPCRS